MTLFQYQNIYTLKNGRIFINHHLNDIVIKINDVKEFKKVNLKPFPIFKQYFNSLYREYITPFSSKNCNIVYLINCRKGYVWGYRTINKVILPEKVINYYIKQGYEWPFDTDGKSTRKKRTIKRI